MLLDVDNKWNSPSIDPYEWRNTDSTKFIMCAPMSKYLNYNSGVQVVNSAIELDLQRQTAPGVNQTVHNYLYHDCLVNIGDNKISIYR
jgi:hypothetical protein